MQQHSAVPLSVADPSRESTAHSPPSRADAVTGINRPRLLASSFSRRLQGDFHAPLLSVLHQPTALFAETEGLLVLIHAKHIQLPIHNIMFSPFVNGVFRVFFHFLCQKGSPASGRGILCRVFAYSAPIFPNPAIKKFMIPLLYVQLFLSSGSGSSSTKSSTSHLNCANDCALRRYNLNTLE